MRYRTKLWLIILTGAILTVICLAYDISSREEVLVLERPESGDGSREELLELKAEGKTYPFTVILQEIPWEEGEVHNLLLSASEGMEELFLNGNTDLSNICTDVCMLSDYPDKPIAVQWYLDTWEYLEPDGTVKNEKLKTPVRVQVQAVLKMEDQSVTWDRDIQICPPQSLSMEQKLQILEDELQKMQTVSGSSEVVLPQEVMEEPVSWHRPQDDRWIWMAVLTVLTFCAVAIGHRKDEEQALRLRERSMELDYAEIVSRLSLYMGAGISTRKAWERIVESYGKKNGEEERRPAYEEMCTALHEMQSGISEALAYERFGTRCRMPAYLKLGTLLSQNLRKGTRGLAELLQEESREAFQNRKALAKKMGEECESKLLLPMLLMLLTVLIMIMYPAVVSFQM